MRYLIVIFLLGLGLYSITELVKERTLIQATQLLNSSKNDQNPSALFSIELANLIKNVSSGTLSSNPGKTLAANYLVRLARNLPNSEQQIKTFCKAFELAGELKKTEPYNSKVLVNWLYWQQILKGTECQIQLEQDERNKLINLAVNNDPTNIDVAYQAALLHVWDNNRAESLPFFARALSLPGTLSPGQEEEVFRNIQSMSDFEVIVPSKFPQIIKWSKILVERQPSYYTEDMVKLKNMQLAAVKTSSNSMHAGTLPANIHLMNLVNIWSVSADDSTRQMIDRHIASVVGEQSSLGEYLTKRASLNLLNINKSFYLQDSLPNRNSLSSWNETKTVALDYNYNSIAFFKDATSKVKVIELKSERKAQALGSGSLQLLVSDDNKSWNNLNFTQEFINNPNIDASWLVLTPANSNFKYLKINYLSNSRKASFSNQLNLLINAYG